MLNQEQIKEIIPHRDPFLLIDEITEMEPGVRVVAKKHIKPEEDWFRGHFPQMPVTPGVLVVEMLAQAGAACVLSMPENKGKIAMFAGINNARFRRQVLPGDVLTLEVEMLKLKKTMGLGKGTASVDGQRCVTLEFSFMFGGSEEENTQD